MRSQSRNVIVCKTASLSIIVILVVGGFTFAIPSSTPMAYAQTNAMYVSAASDIFENHFGGAQVIEVIVNGYYFAGGNYGFSSEPYVTVDDNHLPMYQSRSGNWYGYFVDANMAVVAHEHGMNFGTYNLETGAYDSSYYRNVLFESASPDTSKNDQTSNVPIYTFEFIEGTGIDVELENGAQPETVSLEFDTVEDYAFLELDRSVYSQSAHVHITIQDTWLNIDPTSEDWWTFNTHGDTGAFYRLDPYYPGEYTMAVPTESMMCNGNCVLLLDPGKQDENVVTLQDNGDTALMSIGNPSDPTSWQVIGYDDLSGPSIPAGNIPITVYETGANRGVFTNTDEDCIANLVTTSNIDFRGNTAVINYNGEETNIQVSDNADVDATQPKVVCPSETPIPEAWWGPYYNEDNNITYTHQAIHFNCDLVVNKDGQGGHRSQLTVTFDCDENVGVFPAEFMYGIYDAESCAVLLNYHPNANNEKSITTAILCTTSD